MMKKILAVSALVLSVAGVAQASDQVVISCRGSILSSMSVSENYTISLNEAGDIIVDGQYKNSRGLVILAGTENVIKNDNDGLIIVAAKKRLGMTYSKKMIEVDYRTGKGQVTDYQALESALKPKMIYLDSCTR
ncbi:hypothetical protein [Bdellovibrio svalbardensis]|uniref:Organic solvent tolerance-like N-terminal domain-containing protein n=1 Tax=Bdellovibrio svalbardensis TaxID=2972972 RepID=A0ABT6DM26_9BACT|nr:hypothetical protein [Bdellovibrio svalbardensis]MDG0817930.1 hypothetical protein [Bdellovibrio svalbardensis]